MQDENKTTAGQEVPSQDTLLEPDPLLNGNNVNGDDTAIDLAPYIYPVASFLIPLFVYWRTMCQALYIGDGGDFITASYTLGIPHPPGYPLYTLLGKLFLMLPIPGGLSQAAWRMNFMSAFFGALTILLIYFFILKVTKHNWLAFFAALSVAFAQTFWSQAVITEVYTLNTFFIMLQLNLLILRNEKKTGSMLIWLGLALGLSLAHHSSIAIFFPAYIVYAYMNRDSNLIRLLIVALAFGLLIINPIGIVSIILLVIYEIFFARKMQLDSNFSTSKSALTIGLLLFFLSLCLYGYLPIVGYKNPVTGPMQFNSAKENFSYFVETMTRSIYQYKAVTPGEKFTTTPMVFKRYLEILWDDYLALAFIFFVGFIALRRGNRMAWVSFLCYMLFMVVIFFYPSGDILRAPMKNLAVVMPPLMVPAQMMFMLFGFIGIGVLVDWIPGYVESMKEVDPMPVDKKMKFLNGVIIGSLVVMVLVVIPVHNWYFCDKSNSLTAYNYAKNVIISTPENSFVLNTGDETFLFWYVQLVEKFMPEKKIDCQNWIHNIRDFEILADEDSAIRDVLLWVLKNREWSLTDPEFKEVDHRLRNYDHYCSTFLTDSVQRNAAFASQDAIMHGLVYEFVYKPTEYYEKYDYSISPEKGIVKQLEPGDEATGKKPKYQTFEKRQAEESFLEDDYPGMRLMLSDDFSLDNLEWRGLFIAERDQDGKITQLNYDNAYRDPQEDEIIGRYQELFHNLGIWNMYLANQTDDEEKIDEYMRDSTQSFRREITLKVSDPAGWLSLGNAYLQMRMFDQATQAFEQHNTLVQLNPNSTMQQKAQAHYYLAYAYLVQGDFERAKQEIDSSLMFNQDDALAASLRDKIIEQQDLMVKRMKNLEESIESQENQPDENPEESTEPELDKDQEPELQPVGE